MLQVKNNPVGIDAPIQQLQRFLYQQLNIKWDVTDANFESYGRAYRNNTKVGYVPEVFVASESANNTVYKEVFFDDTLNKVVSFFDVSNLVDYKKGTSSVMVDLIFMVNVPLLKPGIAHRGDEEIRRDVQLLCTMPRFGFFLTEIVTGYKNVFGAFDGWLKQDQVTFRDLHPLHCFRLGFDLNFNINDCSF